MKRVVNVYSEINSLKKVILYRPGNELLNLLPCNLSKYSFRDIPDLEQIQKEYDNFANTLRKEGIDVIYLIDLIVESLNSNLNVRNKFIKQFVKEAGVKNPLVSNQAYKLLNNISDTRKLINKCIEGIRYSEINFPGNNFFKVDMMSDLVIEPLCNLYSLNDIGRSIGSNFLLSSKKGSIHNRESIFIEYVLKYHPKYKNIKLYYDRYDNDLLSSSDILVLNDEVVCLGINKNTNSLAILKFASRLLSEKKFKHILAFSIPENLMSSNLNSLMMMVDDDKFLVHNKFINNTSIYELSLHNEKVVLNSLHMSLNKTLEKYLHLNNITLISIDNSKYFEAEREQMHESINVLCINPKVVVSYKQNHFTNELLRSNGIRVIELNAPNLLIGSRGVNHLTMPLIREK